MLISINDKRIRKIIAECGNGKLVEYVIKNGCVSDVNILQCESPDEKGESSKFDPLMNTKQFQKMSKLMKFVKNGWLDYISPNPKGKCFKSMPKELKKELAPSEDDKECSHNKVSNSQDKSELLLRMSELIPKTENTDYEPDGSVKSVPCPLDSLTDDDIKRLREIGERMDKADPMDMSLVEEFKAVVAEGTADEETENNDVNESGKQR